VNRLFSTTLMGLAFALSANAAWASEASGRITYLIVRDADGLIYFEVDGPRSAKPACAANWNYFMIRDENSASGKRTYALLLSAFLSGRTVEVGGTGACTRWLNGEDVAYVQLR
jgi:predicted lipoprotein with Yx(FWY)xxD motif